MWTCWRCSLCGLLSQAYLGLLHPTEYLQAFRLPEEGHLIAYEWHMGDGCQNSLTDQEAVPEDIPDYLLDKDGNQVRPPDHCGIVPLGSSHFGIIRL